MRRRSSIDDAGWLNPHDHVAWFGDGVGELHAVASRALAAGAVRNEKLLFVAEDPETMRLSGLDQPEGPLLGGQLELLSLEAVYGVGSRFSAGDQLTTFETILAGALADGYRGIRVVADNTPLVRGDDDGFRRWLEWEQLSDRFQSSSMVTVVCFFDRQGLSATRQADLAALHPIRSAGSAEPPFCLFSDGEAISVTGTLDASCAAQFRRLLATVPVDRPLVIDLSGAKVEDHEALLVLDASATADRPVRVRGDARLCALSSQIGVGSPHLRLELSGSGVRRCARCGDAIGVYEPLIIVVDGERRTTSLAAEPDAVAGASGYYHHACGAGA